MLDRTPTTIRSYQSSDDSVSGAADSAAWLASIAGLNEVDVRYEADQKILWQFMKPVGRPSFTPGLIRDLTAVLDAVEHACTGPEQPPIGYLVLASLLPGVFNLGGDLVHFQEMILAGDREGLRTYAHSCVAGQYRRAVRMNLALCTIALVQGDALGGGFEAALSHDVIIAEKSAKFGLPEILFNLFPGMGAYSFLSRRLDAVQAQRLMTSGRLYSADDLFQMGVVDVVVDDGTGVEAVYDFIQSHRRTSRSRLAIAKLRDIATPLSRKELFDITDLWVETALTLEGRDLRNMRHLAAAQDRRASVRVEETAGQRVSA
jgi:DSF synthase